MNRRVLISFGATLIGVASFSLGPGMRADQAAGQIQAQTRPSLRVAPATIRGIVRSTDGKPLRRVQITLVPANPTSPSNYSGIPPPAPTSTNSRGEFQLKNVPPGLYRLTATRSGYLTLQYGQRRPQEAGRTLEVKDGQAVDQVDFTLPKGGVLAGRVTDETGEPYPGVRVTASETRYYNGQLVRFPGPGGVTDDRGQFRIPGLMPGTYYLLAYAPETWRTNNAQRDVYAYGWTFFPGVPADRAEPFALGVSEVRTGIDFRLSPSRAVRVKGRVQLSNGTPAAGATVAAAYEWRGVDAVSATGIGRVTTGPDGSFELIDVPPGDYSLSVSGGQETGRLSITVTGNDVENVVIPLHSNVGSTVSGTVVTDEGTPPPFAATGLRVTIEPIGPGPVLSSLRVFNVDPNWTFKLTSIGGPFIFRFTGLRDDWMLKAVKWNEEDITERELEVPAGGRQLDGLQMVITRKIGKLSGDVVTKDGKSTPDATIVIFADDAKLWVPGTRFIRTTRPDDTGHFTISGLPPGLYRAAARDVVLNGQWQNAEYLEGLKRDAARFQLLEGGTQNVTLRLP